VLNQGENGLFNLATVKCKGEINFIEAIKIPPIGDIEVPPKFFVKPPKDLHWRHPFFGLEVPNKGPVIDSTYDKMPFEGEVKKKSKSKKSKAEKKLDNAAYAIIDEVRLKDGVLEKVKVESGIADTKKKRKRKREES
jgi:hypothetical protein